MLNTLHSSTDNFETKRGPSALSFFAVLIIATVGGDAKANTESDGDNPESENAQLTQKVNAQTVTSTENNRSPLRVLDALHQHAAEAAWDDYFELYLPTAIFIGTDASEHWNMEEFKRYATPTQGWRYTVTQRQWIQHGNIIVFDELLDNQSYGVSRGTGTLIRTEQGWKVAQYHLSFPIPNSIAKDITQKIMAHKHKQ